MTKDDNGRLKDFREFNLDLGNRFPLEIEAIFGSILSLYRPSRILCSSEPSSKASTLVCRFLA